MHFLFLLLPPSRPVISLRKYFHLLSFLLLHLVAPKADPPGGNYHNIVKSIGEPEMVEASSLKNTGGGGERKGDGNISGGR